MRSRGRTKFVELIVILFLVMGIRVVADADALGAISGKTQPNATVTITCGSVVKQAKANAAGAFSVSGLPAGTCTVQANAAGFAPKATRVTLASGGNASVAIVLDARKDLKESEKKPEPAAEQPAIVMKTPIAPSPAAPPPPPPARYMAKPKIAGNVKNQPMVVEQEGNTEQYSRIDDNPFYRSQTAPLSTFSADVDTASYSNLRRFLRDGSRPPKDAVRIEEMINYFSYDYPAPAGNDPFSITTDIGPAPWAPKHMLVRIGLKAPAIDDRQVPARNLVFLLDVSGSMSDPSKLPLLKQAMGLLVETLRPQDKVAIVVYAGSEGLALPPTAGNEKDKIRQAIFALDSGGSTSPARRSSRTASIASSSAPTVISTSASRTKAI
jgi:Ca-activated chloride channel family protein